MDPPPPPGSAEAVARLYESLLFRSPDPEGLRSHVEFMARGASLEEVAGAIREGVEYREVVQPVVRVVEEVYRDLGIPLSPERLASHVREFRASAGSLPEALEAVRRGRVHELAKVRPLWVEMDLTSQCNLRCVMCYFSDPRVSSQPRHDVALDDFFRLAESLFPYVHTLSLSFGAEPLLHRDLARFARVAKDHGVPWVSLYTNGQLLTEEVTRSLVEARVDQVAVSLESVTPGVYERIRVGGDLERLLANLDRFRRVREAMGSEVPQLAFNVVLMRSTLPELPLIVEVAARLGVGQMGTCHLVPYHPSMACESVWHDKALYNAVAARCQEVARQTGVRLSLPPAFQLDTAVAQGAPADSAPPRRSCPFPWTFVGIDAWGHVLPCGWWYGQEPMGNVYESSFPEVWHGPRYTWLRQCLADGTPPACCAACPPAGMGSVDDPCSFGVRHLWQEASAGLPSGSLPPGGGTANFTPPPHRQMN